MDGDEFEHFFGGEFGDLVFGEAEEFVCEHGGGGLRDGAADAFKRNFGDEVCFIEFEIDADFVAAGAVVLDGCGVRFF